MDKIKEENKAGNTNSNTFAEAIYEEISSAIGVNGKNQFLCLQIPGTILNVNDYKYNCSSSASKPLIVEVNEARLANKMFDPCKITESDNGLTLPYQYETALNSLTPKLNKQVIELKNQLRQLLLSEYPYDFGNGIETNYTLQQVYFKLYDDYIEALNEWSKIQSDTKEELRKKYPLESDFKEAYTEWHKTESERYLCTIDEKKSRLVAVFSPNDMKMLEGVLDCGTGAELQEAKSALKKARKRPPTGDYIYPVRFVPANWFDMIGTSFTPNDLMKSPEDLSTDLQSYSLRRMQLCYYTQNIFIGLKEKKILCNDLIQDLDFILDTQKKIDNHEKVIFSKISEWIQENQSETSTLTDSLKKIIITITDIHSVTRKYINTEIIDKLASKSKIKLQAKNIDEKQKIQFFKQLSTIAKTRKDYIAKINELIKKIELVKEIDLNPHRERIYPIINQFKDINEKINIILEQIKQGIEFQSTHLENTTFPIPVPKGFIPVSLKIQKESFVNDYGFIFSGKKSISSNYDLFKNCTISVSMNVTKIGIERDWFNPGIFAQTNNMVKLGNVLISPKHENYNGFNEERLNEMSKCIFPCYPIAMIIARDVSITFDFNERSSMLDALEPIQKQALSGCRFLIFRNMSNNSTVRQSSSHVFSQKKSIIIRIDSTQLIGYCLEATRADKSTSLDVINILEYIQNYNFLIEQNISNKKTKQK